MKINVQRVTRDKKKNIDRAKSASYHSSFMFVSCSAVTAANNNLLIK